MKFKKERNMIDFRQLKFDGYEQDTTLADYSEKSVWFDSTSEEISVYFYVPEMIVSPSNQGLFIMEVLENCEHYKTIIFSTDIFEAQTPEAYAKVLSKYIEKI